MTDTDIIRAFPRYSGPAQPGFIIDFLGSRTRTAYIKGLPRDGGVEDYPTVSNFHATATEWAGALRAVLDAKPGEPLTVAELGAGWGPWLVSLAVAAASRGVHDVRLIGVEGASEHVAFMHTHFADNGIDPRQHRLVHAVVGTDDGVAEFPVLDDPSQLWGSSAVLSADRTMSVRTLVRPVYHRMRALLGRGPRPAARMVRVPSLSIATILRDQPRVDLVHIDIQGHEYAVVASARTVLQQKVRRLVIGTHGRDIEAQLRAELSAHGWVLEADEQCRYHDEVNQQGLTHDGCQVWRNASMP